jgi:hypothetical protein
MTEDRVKWRELVGSIKGEELLYNPSNFQPLMKHLHRTDCYRTKHSLIRWANEPNNNNLGAKSRFLTSEQVVHIVTTLLAI